jgi:putative transposase
MATPRMDITSFVGKLLEQDDVDLLREGVRVLAQAVMETEVSGQIGAGPYERSASRTAYRNGYRTRTWGTRVGTIELKIPEVAAGAYFPSLLEPRRRAEKALHAVVVEAYVKGISTRKVDDLVRALGIDGSAALRSPGSASRSIPKCRRSLPARSRSNVRTYGLTRRSTRSARPVG